MSSPQHWLGPGLIDDQIVQAHHLSHWIVDYVDLEESLAVGSMAQDLLAHAGLMLEHAGVSRDERDELVYVRPAPAWQLSRLSSWAAARWPETVIRQLFFTHASLVLIADDARDGLPSLLPSGAAEVIAAELAVHRNHWRRWTGLLFDRARDELDGAIGEAAGRCGDLFLSVETADPLTAHRGSADALRAAFLAAIEADLSEAGLTMPVLAPPCLRGGPATAAEFAPLLREIQYLHQDPAGLRYEVYP